MALPIFQRTVVTATGDIVSGAEVTVVLEATGLNADIYADRDGLTPLSNPFFTGADGLAQLYAEQGSYRITATGVSGSVTWRYQELIRSIDVTQNTADTATNTADIATNLSTRNLASVTAYVISQYANGDATKVAAISPALPVASYDYFIYEPDLRVYAKNGATGTFSDPLDFDPAAGTDSGVTGTFLIENISGKASIASPVFTGVPLSTTPTAADDSTKIATTAFVKTEVDTGDTFVLARVLGFSQSNTNLIASRLIGTAVVNTTNKTRSVSVTISAAQGNNILLTAEVDSVRIGRTGGYSSNGDHYYCITFLVPSGGTYQVTSAGAATLDTWSECI